MGLSFNLVDEPWIPCSTARDGSVELLGLRDLLARAPEIREIVDESPIVTAALHRLILAILHRNFGPSSPSAWGKLWEQGTWDAGVLERYFEQWRKRFDLFAEQHPFYQDAALDQQYAIPLARRVREIASYTHVTLFEHTPADGAEMVSSARAARFVVAHQAFTVGGLVSLERGQDPKRFKSADAGPLNKGAVALARGGNLFETLMFNFHHYSRADAEPFESSAEDAPAWERARPPRGDDRFPVGYLDLLTWQSRRIRLFPELDAEGRLGVRWVVIMKGDQFPEGWHRRGHETMMAFTRREKPPQGQDPWPAVAFREDRALWRDSLALFQSVSEQRERPKIVDWIADLSADGLLPRQQVLAMDFCGLATNKAAVNFWRHEHLAVPLGYLTNAHLVDRLREGLVLAERVATALGDAAWRLASLIQAPTSGDAGGRQPSPDVVRAYRDRLGPGRAYWSKLEVPFRRFLVDLAEDEGAGDGELIYGAGVFPQWVETLRATAWRAFREASGGLDGSARSLKAVAAGERALRSRLTEILGAAQGAADRRSA